MHIDKGASGWYGIGHTDKQFNSLGKGVADSLKRVKVEDIINLDQLESMSYKKAEQVLKRNYSSMSTTCR